MKNIPNKRLAEEKNRLILTKLINKDISVNRYISCKNYGHRFTFTSFKRTYEI